jgi:hypothetical protein
MTVQAYLLGLIDRLEAEFAEPNFPEAELQRQVMRDDAMRIRTIVFAYLNEHDKDLAD